MCAHPVRAQRRNPGENHIRALARAALYRDRLIAAAQSAGCNVKLCPIKRDWQARPPRRRRADI